MSTVHVTVDCPSCDAPVAVRVDGASEVTVVNGCEEQCHTRSWYPWNALQTEAMDKAAGERSDYLRHLQDDR